MARKPSPSSSQPQPTPHPARFSDLRIIAQGAFNELHEVPYRDPRLARALMDLVGTCPEVAVALETICAYALSSIAGDELGFAVVENESKPYPDTVAIVQAMLARSCSLFGYWAIIWRMMAWGNAYLVSEVNLDLLQIDRFLLLPSWQVFRVEDDAGRVTEFRQALNPGLSEWVSIHPLICSHLRYNPAYLYGRSLFQETVCVSAGAEASDWEAFKQVDTDLLKAVRASAIQPNVHTAPLGATDEWMQSYKQEHELRLQRGIVPDLYLPPGATVGKPGQGSLSTQVEQILKVWQARRARVALRSKVPPYFLGVETIHAREIAQQPARGFVIFVGVVRQLLAEGLRPLINLELALQGVPLEQWHYQIQFPALSELLKPDQSDQDVDAPGVSDVSKESNGRNGAHSFSY